MGDVQEPILAKTGAGVAEWRAEDVVGQLRLDKDTVDLGLPDLSIEDGLAGGARSLLIGVAPVGGKIPDSWIPTLRLALDLGMDVVSGLHSELNDIFELSEAAHRANTSIINLRKSPPSIPIATGKKRRGLRLLTVGTDCAVGKKYTALSLEQCMKAYGMKATFRATGQTGVMISGEGLAIDAVVSDFVSGAAELISPDNDEDHWDIIEGQGSLFNPSYSGVSLGLLHGSQPDAIVVCHDPARSHISTSTNLGLPTIRECIDLSLQCARIVNPNTVCVGVSVNTSALDRKKAENYLQELSAELNIPCIDPLIDGPQPIVDELTKQFPKNSTGYEVLLKAQNTI